MMGDRARARDAMAQAVRDLGNHDAADWYDTGLRDLAGVIAYALSTTIQSVWNATLPSQWRRCGNAPEPPKTTFCC